MTAAPMLLDLPGLLEAAGQRSQSARYYTARDGGAYVLPLPYEDEEPPLTRFAVHVAGHVAGDRAATGWAALVVSHEYMGRLTGPFRLWKGSGGSFDSLDRLEGLALAAALSSMQECGKVYVTLHRKSQGAMLGQQLKAWREAGWIGERWTKIPDVDLWRQIDHHAERLGVSWWSPSGQRPGAWQEIVEAVAAGEGET